MCSIVNDLQVVYPPESLHVVLNGRVIGYVEDDIIPDLISSLKRLKIMQDPDRLVPQELEIGYIPKVTGLEMGFFLAKKRVDDCVHDWVHLEIESSKPFKYFSICLILLYT